MNILVTGATGFVGRRLVRNLAAEYGADALTCLCPPIENDLERSGRANLTNIGVDRQVQTDVRTWNPGQSDFDTVFHLAASTDSGEPDHSVNDIGTKNLIHALGHTLKGKRFIFVSTTAAIDRLGPAHTPLDETTPCHPKTEYGKSKIRAEAIVKELSPAYGYDWTILRYATVYGFGTREKGLFDYFSNWVRNGNFLGRLYFPGKTGLVHVDDAVKITHTLSQDPRAAGETVCVVTESPRTGEIARAMSEALGQKVPRIHFPEFFWQLTRFGLRFPRLFDFTPQPFHNHLWRLSLISDHGLWVSGQKLRSLYDEPMIELEQGIRDVMGLETIQLPEISTEPVLAD
ncbi:MAG: NAD(P)-dependent oxidoreductase [Candidatus Latescibacterota bacterium]|nr:NAD(P)-dependent oxidoreductase [Candidatus Latescibacterota bacterium]